MPKILHVTIFLLISLTASVSSLANSPEDRITTLEDQERVRVTVYNDNLALIKELRTVRLIDGINKLAWREVSALMRPETALLRAADDETTFRLREQNFNYDLLTPQNLLEKYLGRTVRVINVNPATGVESTEAATILSTSEGVVLRFNNRIETGTPGRIVFPSIPDSLRSRPTLSLMLDEVTAGDHKLELSYLTAGLTWQTDYVAELNADDSQLDLSGLVTLTNRSGIAYPNASVQLVAGDINQIQPELYQEQSRKVMAMAADTSSYPATREEPLFEYHLYTLPVPATLSENQAKQIALMSASAIPVSKEYLLRGSDFYYFGKHTRTGNKLKPEVLLQFKNTGTGLGKPLPRGILRVYKNDAEGNAQFIGEDRIEHTARDESVRIRLGKVFDITAERVQTDYQQLAESPKRHTETAHQIEIRNSREEPVTVRVQETIPGDWKMISESLPHTKSAAGLAEWRVTIPAHQKSVLNYRARIKY